MYSLAAILVSTLATVATAAPTGLETRQANTCNVQLTGAGTYCNVQGCKTGFSQYVIEFSVASQTNANNACMRECLRNPDCQSSYVSTDKLCRLYNVPLDSSNFTPSSGATCPGTWNQVTCASLTGECPLAQGGFENFRKTDGYVNPWSKQGTDGFGTKISLLGSGAAGYAATPNGFNFTELSILNGGVAVISQNIRTKLGVPYSVSYLYNFNGVSSSSGSVPKAYTIQVAYCGKTINTLTVSTSANKNIWQTRSFNFTAPKSCPASSKRFYITTAPKNPPSNPSGYTGHIGLDGVTLAAA